jgi:hypothetical protein
MSTRNRFGFVAVGSAALAGIAALFAFGPTACTVLTNDAPLDDAGTYEGGPDGGNTTCAPCVADQCVGAWAVCLTSESCRAVRACANPFAESQGATQECVCSVEAGADAATTAQAAYQMFASCNDARTCTACATDCASSCANGAATTTFTACDVDAGADLDAAADADTDAAADADVDADTDAAADAAPAPVTADGCASCVSGKCGDAKKLCALGTECAGYLGCVYACPPGDEACAQSCGQEHATGQAAAESLASCTFAACSSACGL